MSDGSNAPEGDYRIIGPRDLLPLDFHDRYWNRVREATREVFQADESEVERARDRLKHLEEREPHTIFYNADPLEVAADLAGRKGQPITPQEKVRYQRLLERWEFFPGPDRPQPEDMDINHPED